LCSCFVCDLSVWNTERNAWCVVFICCLFFCAFVYIFVLAFDSFFVTCDKTLLVIVVLIVHTSAKWPRFSLWAVSCRCLTAEALVPSQLMSMGFTEDRSGVNVSRCWVLHFSSCHYHVTNALYSFIHHRRYIICAWLRR
jgi:hypothetical protein